MDVDKYFFPHLGMPAPVRVREGGRCPPTQYRPLHKPQRSILTSPGERGRGRGRERGR